VSSSPVRVRSGAEIARQRRSRQHGCWDNLIAAPPLPMHDANLGTLLRTCDAVGACLAVPRLPWVSDALARGNTLRRPACVHWTGRDVVGWLGRQRSAGSWIVGVALADEREPQCCGGWVARAVPARRLPISASGTASRTAQPGRHIRRSSMTRHPPSVTLRSSPAMGSRATTRSCGHAPSAESFRPGLFCSGRAV
jgi:hypothetical protein